MSYVDVGSFGEVWFTVAAVAADVHVEKQSRSAKRAFKSALFPSDVGTSTLWTLSHGRLAHIHASPTKG